MFPGFTSGFAVMLDDALFAADVASFEVERTPASWRSPSGELVEAVRVHVWVETLSDLARVVTRLGLCRDQSRTGAPTWGGWVTTDAARLLPWPVRLEVVTYGLPRPGEEIPPDIGIAMRAQHGHERARVA